MRWITWLATLAAVTTLAVAQQQSEPRRTGSGARGDGKIASVEEPDFTRFRAVTDQGILAVFDAAAEWDGRDEPASQLAYWHEFASEQLFFFDRLLFTSADVLQSVAAMQRDLDIDPALLLLEKPELSPLPKLSGIGQWRPANELDVVTVMAGGMPSAPEGEVSGLILPCAIPDCGPEAIASGPLTGPVRGTPREELFVMALRGSRCNCSGGGSCRDPDACTNCTVTNGNCVCQPIHCTDHDLCTDDSCDPSRTPPCVFVPIDCDDVDACTPAACADQTGCRTDSFCTEKCCGEYAWCCPHSETCCKNYYDPPDHMGCCPLERPQCCPDATHCCRADQFCCESNCCENEAACCNGDCKGPCNTVCGPDGWHQGPLCGSTWCGPGQICCNGTCCGLGPCYTPKCYPQNGLCVSYSRCDDGDDCTDIPCEPGPGPCGFTCLEPEENSNTCEDDGEVCTNDICLDGQCTHSPKANGTSCTDDGNDCTEDQCIDGTCVHENLPDESSCNDEDLCTELDACYDGVCIGLMCPGICCDDQCCDIGEECCGDSCCAPENCCDDTCCSAGRTAAGSCCVVTECDPPNCDDENPCTKDKCHTPTGECKHTNRVNLSIQGNTSSLDWLSEDLGEQSPGKIICKDVPATEVKPPQISLSIDLRQSPGGESYGSGRLEIEEGNANMIAIDDNANFATPLTLPSTWEIATAKYNRSYFLKALAPGTVKLRLTWTSQPLGASYSDSVAITLRERWTNEDFPQMTFSVTGPGLQVHATSPLPINTLQLVGFGAPPPLPAIGAIAWAPEVEPQSSGTHVSCNQFMVGIIQNMLSYNATFRYGDGDRVANGQTPSLDQMKPTPGPIPFYSAASSKSIAACETTTLSFEDTPEAASTRFNTCEGRNQLFQSISVQNSLETWLVAKHSPSGCYTVLKHFTWGQTAQTPPEAHETHTSSIDNSPGEDVSRIKLKEPIFNHTVGDGDCQPPPN